MRISVSNNFIMPFIFSFIAIIMPIHKVWADTQYVSDKLIITMRDGKSTDFKIIKTLKTGTPVDVLEEDGA